MAVAGAVCLALPACSAAPPGSGQPRRTAARATGVTTGPTRRPVTGGDLGPDVPAAALAPRPAPSGSQLDPARSTLAEDSLYPEHANPEIDTLHHSLDLTYLEGTLSGRDVITFRATVDTPRVRLDLRDALEVVDAQVDGETADVTRDRDGVVVDTGPLKADSRHTLTLAYRGRPRSIPAPSARGDMSAGLGWQVSGGTVSSLSEPYGGLTWYPCNDWAADKAYYDLRVTTSGSVLGIANGELTGRTRAGGRTTTTWHLAQPTAPYLMALVIGDLRWAGVPLADGRTFNLWRPASADQETTALWAGEAKDAYAWLVGKLGPYPFDQVGAVTVPQDTAMETATLISMGENTWGGQGRSVLLHEMAHQWFGDSVTPRDWNALWLNEGWAMYLQIAYLRETGVVALFEDPGQQCRASVGEDGQAGSYYRDRFGASNVYMCGAAILKELHQELGDKEFWAMARAWADAHKDGNVLREDFEFFLQQRYRKDYRPLLRTWLDDVQPLA